ncbi:hypothetical protein PFISCL1PPCAC_16701, partial [Pristionchus fissidentatus]
GRMSTGSGTNSNEDSFNEELEDAFVMMKIDSKTVAANKYPEMAAWFKKNCPTTSEGKPRTPPLPIEELYNIPEMTTPNDVVSDDFPKPVISGETVETAHRSEESASTPEISPTEPKKEKRKYNLKNDAERQDPEYKRYRKENNKYVEKSRQKKKREEEEKKRKNEEEKELLRSTLKKVIEMHECPLIEAEFRANGRVFNRPEGLGVLKEKQDQLYKEIRGEVEK